jgi:hypothetical protein
LEVLGHPVLSAVNVAECAFSTDILIFRVRVDDSRIINEVRMFENRVLRRIFGPKREEGAGGWRRLHNEELHNLHALPANIREIKPRRMR